MARLLGYSTLDGMAAARGRVAGWLRWLGGLGWLDGRTRRARTLERIRRLSWREFELLLGEVYRQRRYLVAGNRLAGGDAGVDLLLRRGGRRTLVHGRHWRRPVVDADPVRRLGDAVDARRGDAGVLVTCGRFTRAARVLARQRAVALVDGRRLYAMVARTDGALARAVLTSPDWPEHD
jgi:restriction system protein